MKIGIHHTNGSFSDRWIAYCEANQINYKLVDCYRSDIILQLDDCDALMWHFHQASPKAILFAKQLLYSVKASGKQVFPDFDTVWHFDDKVGQKYLLEAISAPFVSTYVFYNKEEALEWSKGTTYPKVFKLRGGAGSANVKLVKNIKVARSLIEKAFGKGFKAFDSLGNWKEVFRKFRLGKFTAFDLFKASIRLFYPPEYAKVTGREYGYAYFQDFIPENLYDIRVIVIGEKAFAIKRMVRENDFRASGSGFIKYEKENFDEATIKISFELAAKLNSQCLALDYVYSNNMPLLVEISYGYVKEVYYPCVGYWDKEMNWYEGEFNSQAWMVENLLTSLS